MPGLSDGLLETYHAQFEGLTAPANQIVLFHVDGALAEHAEDDGAVGNRDAAFACVVQSMWAPGLAGRRGESVVGPHRLGGAEAVLDGRQLRQLPDR